MSDRDINEIKDMLNRIIAALYGKAGELNGAGIGLVARTDSNTHRIEALEAIHARQGNRAWDLAMRLLPWAIGIAGMALVATKGMK